MIVLLCEGLERLGFGVDLGELEGWLGERSPGVQFRKIPGPCHRPEDVLDGNLKGAGQVILGLCSVGEGREELHARARKLGFVPGAVEALDLGALCARAHPRPEGTAKAKLLLRAALAKVRACEPSRPENIKPLIPWDHPVGRRSLFTLPPLRYEVVPSIREEACAAEGGCRICADLCPHGALAVGDGRRMVLDKSRCTACGACLSACPRDAFRFPGASLSQVEAQVRALLDGAPSPPGRRAILFLCPRGAPGLDELGRRGLSYPDAWLPVEVPCLGMVTPAWVLQCLSRGAAAVGLLACPPEECRFGRGEELRGRVDYCRALLGEMGRSPEVVRLLAPGEPEGLARSLALAPGTDGTEEPPGAELSFGPRGAGEAILSLARRPGAPPGCSLAHPHSPLGTVRVEEACTLCGACVPACPTGALALEGEEEVALSLDPMACTGCGACVPVCPEGAMQAEKITDIARLSEGKRALFRDVMVRCVRCAAPIAPQAMLNRIGALLGGGPVSSAVRSYCLQCRTMTF